MTNFFGPHSPYLNHPLLSEERTSAEVDQLIRILDLGAGKQVLDVGCGFGRHSLLFAARGVAPTGIDPSETMIAAAKQAAADRGSSATFSVASGEAGLADRFATPFAGPFAGPFDGAIAMFTTVGQIGPDGRDNLGLLATTAKMLAPGAGFVVEVPQRGPAVAGLVTEDRFGDGTNHTEIVRRFDPETARVEERFTVVTDGVTRAFDLAYRLFTADELSAHLAGAGFTNIQLAAALADLDSVSGPAGKPAEVGSGSSYDGTLDPEAPTIYASAVFAD